MKKRENAVVYEKLATGGLCSYFIINGFRFDKFVHFTFTDDHISNLYSRTPPTFRAPACI
ncbi:MAG: hypothetical protein ACLUKN_06620 [Bacilli bacterium]